MIMEDLLNGFIGCCNSLFPSLYGDYIRVDSTHVYFVPKSRPTFVLKKGNEFHHICSSVLSHCPPK